MDLSPGGYELVNPYRTNKADTMDLVELAKEIQKVSVGRKRMINTVGKNCQHTVF